MYVCNIHTTIPATITCPLWPIQSISGLFCSFSAVAGPPPYISLVSTSSCVYEVPIAAVHWENHHLTILLHIVSTAHKSSITRTTGFDHSSFSLAVSFLSAWDCIKPNYSQCLAVTPHPHPLSEGFQDVFDGAITIRDHPFGNSFSIQRGNASLHPRGPDSNFPPLLIPTRRLLDC